MVRATWSTTRSQHHSQRRIRMIETLDFVGVPVPGLRERAPTHLLRRDSRPTQGREVRGRVLGRRPLPRDLGARAARACRSRPQKNGHLALHVADVAEARASLEEKGVEFAGDNVRHGRLPHGPLHGPGRQRPDAPPPVRTAGLTPGCERDREHPGRPLPRTPRSYRCRKTFLPTRDDRPAAG